LNKHLVFYRFLGLHSLLIGLFPFFIPVYLWKAGFSLAYISLFIAISGLCFCFCIRLWEISATHLSLRRLMVLTLLLELALLAINLKFSESFLFLTVFALGNGAYNCFFWTTQRILFADLITTKNSGRQYGNFQIFVMVFLKSGIFAGGLLLQSYGFVWIFGVSALVVVIAILLLRNPALDNPVVKKPFISWKKIIGFKDSNRSKRIFVVDGLFLFLESHFWTVSLFLLSAQNFAKLGVIVIALAVIFAVLFFLAKNTIDRLMGARVYQMAVLLYALAWWLRPWAVENTAVQWLAVLLLLITFFSSFFRLAFNKRFYDLANENDARHYLLVKSYYTQCSVAVVFSFIAIAAWLIADDLFTLQLIYALAGFLALTYLWYRSNYAMLSNEEE